MLDTDTLTRHYLHFKGRLNRSINDYNDTKHDSMSIHLPYIYILCDDMM